MNELSQEARDLLEAAQGGDDPSREDRARVRRALAVAIASGAAASASGTAHAAIAGAEGATAAAGGGAVAAGSSTGAAIFGLKVLAWSSAVAVGVGAGSVAVERAWTGPSRDDVALEKPSAGDLSLADDRSAAPEPSLAEAPLAATPPAPAAGLEGPEDPGDGQQRPAAGPEPPQSTPAAPAAPSTPPAPAPEGLGPEFSLIEGAQRALREGRADRALALLRQHAARFPGGALTEERRAATVLALCALGRTAEARAEARRFAEAAPRSPLLPRIRGSCAHWQEP